MKIMEKQIEAWFVREVEKKGGLTFKFISPGNPGVPDRIVLLPGGKVYFVEMKTSSGKLSRIQRWQIARMRCAGADVRLFRGEADTEKFLQEFLG